MRDFRLRPEDTGAPSTKEDVAEWRVRVEAFLAGELATEAAASQAQS